MHNNSFEYLFAYPVVQTNGSSLMSAGREVLRASIMSMFSLSNMWHRANVLETSLTVESFVQCAAYFF